MFELLFSVGGLFSLLFGLGVGGVWFGLQVECVGFCCCLVGLLDLACFFCFVCSVLLWVF